MKKLLLLLAILPFFMACNGQEKTDLKEIIYSENANTLLNRKVEPTKEAQEMVTKLPAYAFYDQQIENFNFGNINLEKNEDSYVKILVNSFSGSKVLAVMINEKDNPVLAEKIKTYLTNEYGKPKVMEPEPTVKINNIILGNSAYKWINSKNNSTIYFYKNYVKSDGKQAIGFSLHIISNIAEYPTELSDALQTKKVIDWYNTRF